MHLRFISLAISHFVATQHSPKYYCIYYLLEAVKDQCSSFLNPSFGCSWVVLFKLNIITGTFEILVIKGSAF